MYEILFRETWLIGGSQEELVLGSAYRPTPCSSASPEVYRTYGVPRLSYLILGSAPRKP